MTTYDALGEESEKRDNRKFASFGILSFFAGALATGVLLNVVGRAPLSSSGLAAEQLNQLRTSSSDAATCGQAAGPAKKDCDHVDQGSCGNACCALNVKLPGIEVSDAYKALAGYLESGGGDKLFEKGSSTDASGNKSPDDQGDYPFQFKPPLPWRFTTSGFHSTAKGYKDSLFFDVGVLEETQGSQVRLFSVSQINGALGDFGQNYKTLAFLSASLGWKDPEIVYGCGK